MEYTRESSRDFFRQIIPQRLSQLSGSTKKLSPLCRRRSANFLLFRPWAIKAQSYEHKTRPRSSDTFMTPTFPFTVQRECKAIHLHCLISKEKKVKKHKKYLTCKKIVSFRPAMIKKRGKQREAHYNFSSSKKLKIFLDSCYDEGARDAMNNGRIFPALLYGNAAMPTLIQMSRVEQSLPINYAHHHWKNESLESCPKTCSFS